mgnify:CR=1 FL=1
MNGKMIKIKINNKKTLIKNLLIMEMMMDGETGNEMILLSLL